MKIFIANKSGHYHYREQIEKQKSHARQVAAATFSKGGFNPKDARYRSLKGIHLNNREIFTSLTLQLLPITLGTLFLILKYVICL
jgi:hypothetical protein